MLGSGAEPWVPAAAAFATDSTIPLIPSRNVRFSRVPFRSGNCLSAIGTVRIYDRNMAFWDVVQPRHVRQAAAEYDELGQDEFLARYGFGRVRAYLLIIDDKAYDSKAVLGAAYKHATGRPLGPEDFSGGAAGAARVLRALGFEVRNLRKVTD